MQLQGALVRDVSRAAIGHVRGVLLDPETLNARWLEIDVDADVGGDCDHATVLVPAVAASEVAPGELLVPYPAALVSAARHPDGAALGTDDAAELLRHYGFPDRGGPTDE